MNASLPSLDFFQQVIHPSVTGFSAEKLKSSGPPSSVYRLRLSYGTIRPGPASAILKQIQPDWPGDPYGADRELRFYQQLLPRLDIPKVGVFYSGASPAGIDRLLILEDIASSYRFPPPHYTWSRQEVESILCSYAGFHIAGSQGIPPAGERGWLLSYHERVGPPEELARLAADLAQRGVWPRLERVERLVEETLAGSGRLDACRLSLLHNDVYPPNLALPNLPQDPVILIDWEMAGWGLAELDLAYLFLQPFQSARKMPRETALEIYWQARQAAEGSIPAREERLWAMRQAEATLALALLPVAQAAALHPYPAGSPPRAYWDAMFGVLAGSLLELCQGL